MANFAIPSSNDSRNWGSSSRSTTTAESSSPDDRLIRKVRVVVHDNDNPKMKEEFPLGLTDGLALNHWSIFLVISEDRAGIRMDVRTDPLDSKKGLMFWTNYNYTSPRSMIDHWDWNVEGTDDVKWKAEGGVCSEGVHNLLLENGLHRYRVDKSGQGCRYWILTAFNLLMNQGWIEQKDGQNLESIIGNHYYPKDREQKPTPSEMVKGSFFEEGEEEP